MVSAGSITVAVRVRPPNSWEAARLPAPCTQIGMRGDGALSSPGKVVMSTGLREVVKIVDDRVLMFDPDEKDSVRSFVERGFVPPGTRRYKDKRFIFDRVLDADASQYAVYESTAKPLLDGLLDGFNATVFAYGATGCGKTHTISGIEEDPGIIYLTMSDLFRKIEERRSDYHVDINVTFLEIYNEEIRDLLAEPGTPAPRGGLQIREDKTVRVVGLVELNPTSAEQIKEIVLLGNTRRTQSPTHANETSSRSHAVLQVHVTQSPRTASTTEQRTMATLSIIDLAGSERAAATMNMGQRMVEGANINKSLLALGNCINALCESGGGTRHVPYRNSKLTRLLKFSLGGNCKTVMIVCVAPASNHFDDTHNTLLYADRASKIKTKVVTRNVVNVDRHVGQYVEAINRLNHEVAELKAKLSGKMKGEADVQRRKKTDVKAEMDRVKSDLQRKVDHTQASIVDGANCQARLDIAQLKLAILRERLDKLEGDQFSPDYVAEQELLHHLISQEQELIQPGSELNSRLLKSGNSTNMFNATLRAVVERRWDQSDEFALENVKSDANRQRATMAQLKAEAERDSLKDALRAQTELVTMLLGHLTRSTVMMEEGGNVIQKALGEDQTSLDTTARSASTSLLTVANSNYAMLASITGKSLGNVVSDIPQALYSFSSRPPAVMPVIQLNSRRFSSDFRSKNVRRLSGLGSPARRSVKASPRRSSRGSISSSSLHVPHRRIPSDKALEKKKNVQWKDEAGRGTLDDGGSSLSVVEPETSYSRPPSVLESESEWVDEKTDDSSSFTFASLPSRDLPPAKSALKRTRTHRAESTLRSPGLGSLTEVEESKDDYEVRRSNPLTSRLNNCPTPPRGSKSINDHQPESPTARRASTSLRPPGSATKSRRRSNIGPLRSSKARRRSSLLPQPVLPEAENPVKGGAKRVLMSQTPMKRLKRESFASSSRTPLPAKQTSLKSSVSVPAEMSDTGLKGWKPSWR